MVDETQKSRLGFEAIKAYIELGFPLVSLIGGGGNKLVNFIAERSTEVTKAVGALEESIWQTEDWLAIGKDKSLTLSNKKEQLQTLGENKEEVSYICKLIFNPGDDDCYYVKIYSEDIPSNGNLIVNERHNHLFNAKPKVINVGQMIMLVPMIDSIKRSIVGIANAAYPCATKTAKFRVTELGINFGGMRGQQYLHNDFPGYTVDDWKNCDFRMSLFIPLSSNG